MTGRTRKRVGAGAAALVAVTLAACTGSGDAATNTATNDAGLIVLQDDIARSINGDGPDGGNPSAQELVANLTDPLVTYPTDNQGGVAVPDFRAAEMDAALAESWELSEDGRTWTFNLRKDAKSCAGNTLTADDVLYTFARAKSASGAAPIGWFLGFAGNVWGAEPIAANATEEDKKLQAEVTKVDDHTVRITQSAKTDLFPRVTEVFSLRILDSKAMQEKAAEDDPWTHRQSVEGFGAYCLDDYRPGQRVVLTSNPGYWRGEPEFKRVTLTKVPSESDRIAALASGQADLATNLTPKGYQRVVASGATAPSWQGTKALHLGINYLFPPFDTEKGDLIREAIAHAIPYDVIAQTSYLGNATKADSLFSPSLNGFTSSPGYKTDLERAKELLAEAGYPGGAGLEQFQDTFTLYYVTERASLLDPVANQIKSSFAELGITLRLAPISQTEEINREVTKRDMSMFLRDFNRPLVPDAGYATVLWHVSADQGGLNASSNYVNAEVNELYQKSQNASGQERQVILDAIQKQVNQDLPLVPILDVPSQLALREGLGGWVGHSGDAVLFWYLKGTAK